uniref:Putative CMP/dCMP deaminase zinc-binding n=1 Tax=viral metagenome TaxID=1070528 RepID=A0A6M3JVS4_9ZZZZ
METTYTEQYLIQKQLEKDLYFLRLAREVSKSSKCLSRKIGSVLVKDGCIISTGYNGPAKGVKHCDERKYFFYEKLDNKILAGSFEHQNNYLTVCPRRIFDYKSGQGLHLCQAGHSERNAIIQAARNGIATKDTILYAYCAIPCKDCMIECINAGIKEIVCLKSDKSYDNYSRIIQEESGILLREIDSTLL